MPQGTWPELDGMPVLVVSGHRADWQGRDTDIECYNWDPVTTVGYRVAFGDRSKADKGSKTSERQLQQDTSVAALPTLTFLSFDRGQSCPGSC